MARTAAPKQPPITQAEVSQALADGLRALPSLRDVIAARGSFLEFMRVCGPEKLRKEADESVFQFLCHATEAIFNARAKAVIAAPPGIWKSAVAMTFPVYAVARDANVRTVATTLNAKDTMKQVNDARSLLQSKDFRGCFPETKIDHIRERHQQRLGETEAASTGKTFTMNCWYVKRQESDPNPSMEAVPYFGKALNRRIDFLIADDIETSETARTLEGRDRTYTTLMTKWMSRLVDVRSRGAALVLSNCWHEDDLIHRLKRDGDFISIWIYCSERFDGFTIEVSGDKENILLPALSQVPGIARRTDGTWSCPFPSDSDEYSFGSMVKKQQVDPYFACKFFFRPMSDKDRMFPSWHSRRIHPGTVAGMFPESIDRGGLVEFPPHVRQRYAFAWSLDMAGGKRLGEMLKCVNVDSNGVYRPIEIYYSENFTLDQIISIIESARARGIIPCTFRMEDNAAQKKVVTEMQITANKRALAWASIIEPHHTGTDKMDAQHGLPSIELLIREGKYEYPQGMESLPGEIGEHWRRFASQMANCPRFPRPNETPEAPMTTWFCIKGLRERGYIRAAHSGTAARGIQTFACREVSIV
jgi:hypothetical protein